MIKLSEPEKNITKNLSNKKIKSINNFCEISYTTEILNKPLKNEYKNFKNIIIYNDPKYAHEIARTFRFLIQAYIESEYIKIQDDFSLLKLKPFWDYDTQVYYKNMTVFNELNDSCEKYSQKIFILNKPIRLTILALLGRLPEKSDFKIIILKKLKLHIDNNYNFYKILIAIISIAFAIISWIFDFASFKSMVISIFK